MSDIYDDVIRTESERIKTNRAEMTVVNYNNADCVRDQDFRTETESPSVKIRSSRAAVVCLVLLCVLLLTAVVVLCVHIHTKSTNYTQERDELLTKFTNLTEERDELIIQNGNLSNERNQLINQLSVLGKEDQCSDNPKWITYKRSSYYISSEWKNWVDSRRDCLKRGADLVIINNEDEQAFITKVTSANIVWIGLTERDEASVWKWVDGNALTTGIWSFWGPSEPNNAIGDEDCAVSHFEWADYPCHYTFVWICERHLEV